MWVIIFPVAIYKSREAKYNRKMEIQMITDFLIGTDFTYTKFSQRFINIESVYES